MIRSSFLMTSFSLIAAASQEPVTAQTALLNLRVGCTASDTYGSGYFARDMGFLRKPD